MGLFSVFWLNVSTKYLGKPEYEASYWVFSLVTERARVAHQCYNHTKTKSIYLNHFFFFPVVQTRFFG